MSASRIGVRETPKRSAISVSSSRSPGLSLPETISFSSASRRRIAASPRMSFFSRRQWAKRLRFEQERSHTQHYFLYTRLLTENTEPRSVLAEYWAFRAFEADLGCKSEISRRPVADHLRTEPGAFVESAHPAAFGRGTCRERHRALRAIAVRPGRGLGHGDCRRNSRRLSYAEDRRADRLLRSARAFLRPGKDAAGSRLQSIRERSFRPQCKRSAGSRRAAAAKSHPPAESRARRDARSRADARAFAWRNDAALGPAAG